MSEILESKIIGDSSIIATSPIAMMPGMPIDMTSLDNLPEGEWLVWGNIFFNCSIGQTLVAAWLNDKPASFPDGPFKNQIQGASLGACGINVPIQVFKISAGSKIYLTGYSLFTTGTVSMYGSLNARGI